MMYGSMEANFSLSRTASGVSIRSAVHTQKMIRGLLPRLRQRDIFPLPYFHDLHTPLYSTPSFFQHIPNEHRKDRKS